VFTFDLTASNGDYLSKTEVITLDSTNTARNFVVTILNDNTVENTETFGVNITTDESQVRIQDETVIITILDEDSKFDEPQCDIALHIVTVQYSTVQYSTVQYSTAQYSTVQYSTVQEHKEPTL
jgi:hypothetical protein